MKALRLLVLLISTVAFAQVQVKPRISEFAHAIAMQEGFYVKGSVAQRFHNPGNIRTRLAHAYPGQVRVTPHLYAVFINEKYGWRALEHNLDKIYNDESRYYNRDMSITQIAKIYARDPRWVTNVCKILNIDPSITFAEYIDSEKDNHVQETKPDASVIGAAYSGPRTITLGTLIGQAVPRWTTLRNGGEPEGRPTRLPQDKRLQNDDGNGRGRNAGAYQAALSNVVTVQSALRSPPDRGVPRDS